jgi:hypothetical protein
MKEKVNAVIAQKLENRRNATTKRDINLPNSTIGSKNFFMFISVTSYSRILCPNEPNT